MSRNKVLLKHGHIYFVLDSQLDCAELASLLHGSAHAGHLSFPTGSLCPGPPEDLLVKPSSVEQCTDVWISKQWACFIPGSQDRTVLRSKWSKMCKSALKIQWILLFSKQWLVIVRFQCILFFFVCLVIRLFKQKKKKIRKLRSWHLVWALHGN